MNVTYLPRLLLVYLGLAIIFSGCTAARKQYFQVTLPAMTVNSPRNAESGPRPAVKQVILIRPVEVEDIYNDYRVVYRYSPYQLNYYPYHFWIKKPASMIRDAIMTYLSLSGKFEKAIIRYDFGEPDLTLKAVVYVLEEFDQGKSGYGHLKMEIEVREYKTTKLLLHHRFDRTEPLAGPRASYLPVVISKILQEELDIVLSKL